MIRAYVDQNFLINCSNSEERHARALAVVQTGAVGFVLSPWHFFEIGRLDLARSEELIEVADSLSPEWILDRSDLEVGEFGAAWSKFYGFPNEFASDETMFDRLVRMQHFGLPTRLLDVSLNALVALYFATDPSPEGSPPTDGKVTAFAVHEEREKYYDSDSVSCLANLANMTTDEKLEIEAARKRLNSIPEDRRIKTFNEEDVMKRLHQFIRSEKAYFLPIVDPVDLYQPYFVHPKMSNRRILAQSGAFIIHGLPPPTKMYFPRPIEETDFVMPAASKRAVRQSLESLGINQSTLFPEIDKAANRIKNRYLKKKGTA